jgi:diguanylate cyclase (GGDEF)-like protein/PAS domain S-box-containing protein
MRYPSALPDESDRLRALAEYGLGSERPLRSLDPVVQIAVRAFDVPAAAVNMIGREEVFFAASAGIAKCDMSRDVSFCAHAITQEDVLVVEDARLDARFHDNPLVTGPAQLRFYAGAPVRSPDGHGLGALCIIDSKPHASFSLEDRARLKEMAKLVCDRLELRRLEVAGREGLRKFERIALTSPNGIVCFDRAGIVTALNPAAETMFGRSAAGMVGAQLELLLPAWGRSQIVRRLESVNVTSVPEGESGEDFIGRRWDGSEFPLEIAWSAWMEGEEPNFGLVLRDLTEHRRQQDELYRLANFDHVTGFPNPNLFHERVVEETRGERPAALLALGLNGYQDVSDTLGHATGEKVLQQIAQRLQHCVRATDVVAKLAGDQFGICLVGVGDPLRAAEAAAVAMAAVAQPLAVDGSEVRLEAHCGIALCPGHGSEAEELIGNANLALQEARKQAAGQAFLFVPALRMQAVARRMFDSELHRAVEREELQLYFQPLVRLADGSLSGAEALLRWNHPERGVLAPAAFLPALEASSLAALVGNWIVDKACRQAAEWRGELTPDFRMSINLFAAQFRCGQLRSIVRDAMARYGLTGGAIELEITETTVLDDEALFLPLLEGLSEDGVQLAFDDFGTGFASLSLLARYPLTHLKIDKSFIHKAFVSDRDRAIVHAITDLAHRLDLEVIAEGVESRRYLDFCRDIGCDEAQGFLIGRPVPAAQFAAACQKRLGRSRRRA